MAVRKIFVLISCLLVHVVVSECPEGCVCLNANRVLLNQISCLGANLDDVPRDLPPSLTYLDLDNNNIQLLLTKSLAQLRGIELLRMSNNRISAIQNGAFEKLSSLKVLELNKNNLRRVSESTFRGAHNLTSLDLSNNQLQAVDGAFARMLELTRLDLRNNKLTEITQFTFRDLSNLRYLLLGENSIHSIDKQAFMNLEQLMYLVLKGNPLGQMNRFYFSSSLLSYIDLSECKLTQVPRGLPNSLRYLQLRRNNLTAIHKGTFKENSFISILVLDDNGIKKIDDKAFGHMMYLQQLWLNNNKIGVISSHLPNSLQRLIMDSNLVREVTNVFAHNNQLDTLSLMSNNITHLAGDALSGLTHLKFLDLSNNQLQKLYNYTFAKNRNLQTLYLSKNPLINFHSHCFHKMFSLQNLSLAYNDGHPVLPSDLFSDLQNLKTLYLDNSPHLISAILGSRPLLLSLRSVEVLSMQTSDLTYIGSDFPLSLPNLEMLSISSAWWHCDRRMIWFRDWLTSTKVQISDKENIRCFTPRELHKRSIISLTDDEFADTVLLPKEPTPEFITRPAEKQLPSRVSTSRVKYIVPSNEDESSEIEEEVEPFYTTTTASPSRPTPSTVTRRVVVDNELLATEEPVSWKSTIPNRTATERRAMSVAMISIVVGTTAFTLVVSIILIGLIIHFIHKQNNNKEKQTTTIGRYRQGRLPIQEIIAGDQRLLPESAENV